MPSAGTFYNFSLNLSQVDQQVFHQERLKVYQHPLEDLSHLYARMIGFLHSWRPGLEFTQGLGEPGQPTFWARSVVGEILLWGQVGSLTKKKIQHTLKSDPRSQHRVYFYDRAQIHQFCHELRGSKTNWVEPVTFFQVDSGLLEGLVPLERSSPEWSITFVDDHMYLVVDGSEFETTITSLDIWAEYQAHLDESSERSAQ